MYQTMGLDLTVQGINNLLDDGAYAPEYVCNVSQLLIRLLSSMDSDNTSIKINDACAYVLGIG